jgi:hypothetical protein
LITTETRKKLEAELAALQRDMAEAEQAIANAAPEADRCEGIFRAADKALRDAVEARDRAGQRWPLFHLYDARMHAGHAWNPHRSRLRDAIRWHKAVCDAAAAIEKKLDEHTTPDKGKSQP